AIASPPPPGAPSELHPNHLNRVPPMRNLARRLWHRWFINKHGEFDRYWVGYFIGLAVGFVLWRLHWLGP
ncbi:hypothetical protein U2083_14185, partial [Listeria monocytogenes]|uniref:hypothetical protein n=1 Tax=Listeria monocytogenes TaxID=1639 RepID=UPI002FDC12E7